MRRVFFRRLVDKLFTAGAGISVLLMVAALVITLGPMLFRGAGAVIFKGTVEFRKLQFDVHHRGDPDAHRKELAEVNAARRPVYALLDAFRQGLDTTNLQEQARQVYREYGKQLRNEGLDEDQQFARRRVARHIREKLEDAYATTDKADALADLDAIRDNPQASQLKGTVAERLLTMAQAYRKVVQTVDLSKRNEYAKSLREILKGVRELFGPRPGTPQPALLEDQYGATRMDRVRKVMEKIMYETRWVPVGPGKPLQKKRFPRAQEFAGTKLAALFPLLQNHLADMMRPRWTFYWQYFIDDSTPGHFFGGVGPEILGTLLLTLVAMLSAVPLGIISAAYLVEFGGEGRGVRIIRTCINSLAGVPSIVFGLFGLAFFVIVLLPHFGLHGPTIWAGGLTLGLLVLPVVIRASEEAIRSVPHTYKEASLALGASRLRTFVTVILPAALPGVLTGVILSMSRAAGETAPLLFTAAMAVAPVPHSLGDPTRALSTGSYFLATGDLKAFQAPHNQYGMVMTLIVLVLLMNLAAILVRSRIARKLRGQ